MNDNVNHPGHYALHYPLEVKDVIEIVLINAYGPDAYKAYCLGNELKYRLRAGFKGEPGEDIAKAMKYMEFREEAAEESRDDLVFGDHSERTAAESMESWTDEEPEHRIRHDAPGQDIRWTDSKAPSDVPYSEIPVTGKEDEEFEVLSVRRDKRN